MNWKINHIVYEFDSKLLPKEWERESDVWRTDYIEAIEEMGSAVHRTYPTLSWMLHPTMGRYEV